MLSKGRTDFNTDDGSTDRTAEVLPRLQLQHPETRLRIVTHEHNRGYGAALASGFDAAESELIFMTDGDLQFDIGELAILLPALDARTDMVIGWRRHRADSPIRRRKCLALEAGDPRPLRLHGPRRRLRL